MGINRYPGNVITSDANTPTVTSASGTWTLEEAYQNIGNWPMAQSQIQNSLRFNSADSAYLSRTFPSAGNRRTWTFSAWVKRSGLSTTDPVTIFSAGPDGTSPRGILDFNNTDTLRFGFNDGSSWYLAETTAVFRDPSAWYHVVVKCDLTNSTQANRVGVYVNGVQQTTNSVSWPNADQVFNNAVFHGIGRNYANGTYYFPGYLTEINFIDGLALDADYFGFTDANGIWQPKPYKGAYGTNGFYLPMTLSATATGFSTVTYEGTGTTNNITGVGFQPDFVWIKERTSTSYHELNDIVRGVNKQLFSNSTDAEESTTMLTAFNPDGFSLAAQNAVNESNQNYVAWCWDAGSSTVTNNDGTITSTVRASQTNGVSIVTYTSTTGTVGHGLGVAPAMIIMKGRNVTDQWTVGHQSLNGGVNAWNYGLPLNDTASTQTNSGFWNNTAPTSTVFSQGSWDSGYTKVAYCFSEISGFSKFGSYTGNGSSTGPTVTTGFKPAFVMVKRTDSTGHWVMMDSTRDPVSPIDKKLLASASDAEITGSNLVSFTDTGFQLVDTNTGTGAVNESGATYIYMAFADTRAFDPFDDYSGNGNNWQPNNIGTDDVFTDVPTNQGTDTGVGGEVRGNYATLNPLQPFGTTPTFTNGNLTISANNGGAFSTIGLPTTGKWYFEVTVVSGGATTNIDQIGLSRNTPSLFSWYRVYRSNATKDDGSTAPSYGATWTTGDIIGTAWNADTGDLTFYKNGVSQGVAYSGITEQNLQFIVYCRAITSVPTLAANFGQLPFAYAAPTGFKALCTTNLPDPAIADGSDNFGILTWTGDGNTGRTIATGQSGVTGTVGFTPDFAWIKSRSDVNNHALTDILRGGTAQLRSNTTDAEVQYGDMNLSFVNGGFSNAGSADNESARTFVAWNWKAGGTGVSNTDGSITSTVSANTTAGFSVITYTGNGTSGATVGHGLGAEPYMMILKARTQAESWGVYHKFGNASPQNGFFRLESTDAFVTSSSQWNNTAPGSSVFTLGNDTRSNRNGYTYVMYAFAPVAGFSAFGKYVGSGSQPGTFTYLGFKPAFLLVKEADGIDGWGVYDDARNTYNPESYLLQAQDSGAESSAAANYIDFLSNGFRVCTGGTQGNFLNESGKTYIYAAFASNPFKISRAR